MDVSNNGEMIQGHECYSSCLGYVLRKCYMEMSPNKIIILGDGMNVYYDSEKRILGTNMFNANKTFMTENHLKRNVYLETDEEQAINRLKDLLGNDCIPIIKLHPMYIGYHRIFSQGKEGTHFVCIEGLQNETIKIVDCYVPTQNPTMFEGWIELKDVMEAWKAMDYEIHVIHTGEYVNKNTEEHIRKKMQEGITAYLDGNNENGMIGGQKAIISLFDDIVKHREELTYEELININYQIKIFGFISLKCILFDEIEAILAQEAAYGKEIVGEWNKICSFMLKCGISKKEKNYELLEQRVKECIKKEEELLKKIRELL